MTKQIYFIEGNIGAGKSSLLNSLDKNKFNVLDEPIELYCKFGSFNPLDMFYKKELTSFQFAVYNISLSFDIILNKIVDNKINILCRNPFSIVFCFTYLSKINNEISEIEYKILIQYINIYKKILSDFDIKFIYLRTESNICYKRLKERNRIEEQNVSYEYIQQLGFVYDDYITDKASYYLTIVIDGSNTIEEIKNEFMRAMQEINI